MEMRKCRVCGEEKELESFFPKKTSGKEGHLSLCKDCQSARYREYYKKNRDRIYERAKAATRERYATDSEYRERIKKKAAVYRERNPEKVRESVDNWNARNPEKRRKAVDNWNARNPEKRRESAAKWAARNPEKRREIQRRYRERIKAETRDFTQTST